MTKDKLLKAILSFMLPIIVLFFSYIQVYGEYSPGGGFQSGAILSSGLIFYTLLNSCRSVTSIFSIYSFIRLSSFGVLFYILIGLYSMFLGDNFLEYTISQAMGVTLVELGIALTVFSVMSSNYFVLSSVIDVEF
ncbi:MAG: multisubunit Na+/H+ antiporter, MnhB subunit [Candidatus Xenolissoclinum pacificiensis L6]|uniref:Multisubunit Na+/H+ antiporter, MnhB subunit n=1 Tax=Candidatus Xenolissoclinum pacificiensis L6 TaxID=1401685 RepID=W2V2Y1_9RICK|nr:MAG: multisubunit Na+/H+ antiporter, MnhB subunit [Candidatus Xenolissoclinum pacificiensis L6]